MESSNRKVIILAIVMALFTTFLIYLYIRKAITRSDVVSYVDVYVAAKTLPAKHVMEEGDIKKIKVAREYLNPNAIVNKAEIIGKRLKEKIISGEQILYDRLVTEKDMTLAYNIPKGMRAVSLNVDEQIEVANLINPGDRVDIIASFESEVAEDKNNRTVYPRITKTVIQNALVLALGQNMSEEQDRKELPKTVTVALSPEDAEKLVYITEYAKVRMALRNIDDEKTVRTSGVTRNDLTANKEVMVYPK